MKWIFIIILLLTPTFSHADDCTKKEISGKALEYHYGDNFYLVIATTETRVFIELRSYNSDKLIQDKPDPSIARNKTIIIMDFIFVHNSCICFAS